MSLLALFHPLCQSEWKTSSPGVDSISLLLLQQLHCYFLQRHLHDLQFHTCKHADYRSKEIILKLPPKGDKYNNTYKSVLNDEEPGVTH